MTVLTLHVLVNKVLHLQLPSRAGNFLRKPQWVNITFQQGLIIEGGLQIFTVVLIKLAVVCDLFIYLDDGKSRFAWNVVVRY
jgi:hypothetical protein